MDWVGIGGIVNGVGDIIDDLHTSDEEKLHAELERQKLDVAVVRGEQSIELARAKHKSILVAGGRPALIWIGVFGLGYQFLIYPFLLWVWSILVGLGVLDASVTPPPPLDWQQLMVLAGASGTVAGMRSYDKSKGTETNSLR